MPCANMCSANPATRGQAWPAISSPGFGAVCRRHPRVLCLLLLSGRVRLPWQITVTRKNAEIEQPVDRVEAVEI